MVLIKPAFPVDSIAGWVRNSQNLVYYPLHGKIVARRKGMNPQHENSRRNWFYHSFQIISPAWNALTQAQARSWQDAAEYLNNLDRDEDPHLTGRQLFFRIQTFRRLSNVAISTAPPTDLSAPGYAWKCDLVQWASSNNAARIRLYYKTGHQASTALFIKISPSFTSPHRRPRRWEFATFSDPNNQTPLISQGVPPVKTTVSQYLPYAMSVGVFIWVKVVCVSPGFVPGRPQFIGPLEVTQWP